MSTMEPNKMNIENLAKNHLIRIETTIQIAITSTKSTTIYSIVVIVHWPVPSVNTKRSISLSRYHSRKSYSNHKLIVEDRTTTTKICHCSQIEEVSGLLFCRTTKTTIILTSYLLEIYLNIIMSLQKQNKQ